MEKSMIAWGTVEGGLSTYAGMLTIATSLQA